MWEEERVRRKARDRQPQLRQDDPSRSSRWCGSTSSSWRRTTGRGSRAATAGTSSATTGATGRSRRSCMIGIRWTGESTGGRARRTRVDGTAGVLLPRMCHPTRRRSRASWVPVRLQLRPGHRGLRTAQAAAVRGLRAPKERNPSPVHSSPAVWRSIPHWTCHLVAKPFGQPGLVRRAFESGT